MSKVCFELNKQIIMIFDTQILYYTVETRLDTVKTRLILQTAKMWTLRKILRVKRRSHMRIPKR